MKEKKKTNMKNSPSLASLPSVESSWPRLLRSAARDLRIRALYYEFLAAILELEKALAMDAKIPMAHFLLGEIYLYKSSVAQALDEFHKELQISPILWLVYWRLGDAYTRLEKWDQAERALKQAIWLNQDFSGSFILLGKVELKKGDARLASEFLERALRMDPNNFSAHYLLGTAYKGLGRKTEAEHEFELSRTLHEKTEP